MLNISFLGYTDRENKVRVLTRLSTLLQAVSLTLCGKFPKIVAYEKDLYSYEVSFEEDGLLGRIKTLFGIGNRDYLRVVLTALNLIEDKKTSDKVIRYLVDDFLQACYETEGVELKTEEKAILIKEKYL